MRGDCLHLCVVAQQWGPGELTVLLSREAEALWTCTCLLFQILLVALTELLLLCLVLVM